MIKALFLIALLVSFSSWAQTRVTLPTPINTKSTLESMPSLSGDGKTIVFQSALNSVKDAEFMISYLKGSTWSRPEPISTINTPIKTIYTGDLTISHDGKSIVFTSSKNGGIGAKDIWITEKKGGVWQTATNIGKPINSTANEGDPSLSPDGKFLYFTRYSAEKTPAGIPCGKLYRAERVSGTHYWKEPVALSSNINKGCECNSRIMADGQTLYFSSMRTGGKGEYDQYVTRLDEKGIWSEPQALEFINTANDDRYISVSALGSTIFYTIEENKQTDIASSMLPTALQPKPVIYWHGSITNANNKQKLSARILIIDKKTNKLNVIQNNDDGSFDVFIPEGNTYDIAVQANTKGFLFYSTLLELNNLNNYKEISEDIELKPIATNASIVLNNIQFEPASATLTSFSSSELNRIAALLRDNPSSNIEIGVHTDLVKKDTIQQAGLTEITQDTLSSTQDDSTGITSYTIRKTYHNDYTNKQAKAIADYVITKGIPASRIQYKGYGDTKPITPAVSDPAENKRIILTVLK